MGEEGKDEAWEKAGNEAGEGEESFSSVFVLAIESALVWTAHCYADCNNPAVQNGCFIHLKR